MQRSPKTEAEAQSPRYFARPNPLCSLRLLPTSVARHFLFLLRSHPALADLWGYHVRSIHYYEPLPDFREITREQTVRRHVSPAITYNLPAQVDLVRRLGQNYSVELDELAATPEPEGFNFRNDYFGGLDAAVYYALTRQLKPGRVIEMAPATLLASSIKRSAATEPKGEVASLSASSRIFSLG